MTHLILLCALLKFAVATFDPDLDHKYQTMPPDDFINYFNYQNYTWKMTGYPQLEGKNLFGAFIDYNYDLEIESHDPEWLENLPENFDARDKWAGCQSIKEIYNQGDCGSCWAFGAATVASDRTCIHKYLTVRLSEQDFQCLQPRVCSGGYPKEAFDFWRDSGLVTLDCKPYNITELKKGIPCVRKCVDEGINYEEDKHFAERVYSISNVSDSIRAELFQNGPIQAGFEVYADFRGYKSGIYEHKVGGWVGRHSVRVVGYGVENGVEYWLITNSWGNTWGENGLVKIKRYQEELLFENYLLAGIPKN